MTKRVLVFGIILVQVPRTSPVAEKVKYLIGALMFEYGTKCFPWIARKKPSGEFVPLKLSKAGQGYVECRFTITIEDLERVGREDLIRVRRARSSEKTHDGYARNEGVWKQICIVDDRQLFKIHGRKIT